MIFLKVSSSGHEVEEIGRGSLAALLSYYHQPATCRSVCLTLSREEVCSLYLGLCILRGQWVNDCCSVGDSGSIFNTVSPLVKHTSVVGDVKKKKKKNTRERDDRASTQKRAPGGCSLLLTDR